MRLANIAIAGAALLALSFTPASLLAQGVARPPQDTRARITQAIDESQRLRLAGNTHPLARPEFDRGAAPASMALNRMLLVLRRSPAQEAELQDLLVQQQATGSPLYHRWLTPAEYGERFGVADADVSAVTGWLTSHGFSVGQVAKGANLVEFSGNAGQVSEALHTEIHRYEVKGASYWANNQDPEIPEALAPVVVGIASLNNFPRPTVKPVGHGKELASTPGAPRPAMNFCNSSADPCPPSSTGHALVPGDFATIYNVNPLYSAQTPINGQGQTIAVVARSRYNADDVADFRRLFLPQQAANVPTVIVNGPDPGDLGGGEESEATLDAEWSGAMAPNATVDFVVSDTTDTTDGTDLSLAYIIDRNLAPVMSISFGGCEADEGTAGNQFHAEEFEQAAAQGITVIVASGDLGPDGCDYANVQAQDGLGVSGTASTPYNLALGGTQFNDNNGSSLYWNSTAGTYYASANSYIPEKVWNESCAATCGQNAGLAASGGGVSTIYPKPVWQQAQGVPNDGARDLPDLSLASALYDGYVICIDASCNGGAESGFSFDVVSGTSVSAQAFAGVMALVNQATGSNGQGLANPTLYKLAQGENWSACAASSPAADCVFIDTVAGNSAVPCEAGSPNCSAATLNSVTASGAVAYPAGTGYDLATGLGSINVTNLVNAWASGSHAATTTTMTLSPTTLTHGQPVTVTSSVAASGASTQQTPTGSVALLVQGNAASAVTTAPLAAGAASITFPSGNNRDALPGGTYSVYLRYDGDTNFAPSNSSTQSVTVAPEPSSTALVIGSTFDPKTGALVPIGSTVTYGTPLYFKASVIGASGSGQPTGTVTLNLGTGGTINAGLSGPDINCGCSNSVAMPFNYYSNFSAGPYRFVANYPGDASFNASSSATATLTVTPTPTTVTATSNSIGNSVNVEVDTQVPYSAPGSGEFSPVGPGGAITLYIDGVEAASGTLSFATGTSTSNFYATSAFTLPVWPNGTHQITVAYQGNANYAASTSSPLTMTFSAPGISLSPGTLSFASQAPGTTSAPQTLTVSNPGTLPLALQSVAVSGDFAEISNCPASLPAGGQCGISVTFTPTFAGIRSGVLTVTDNAYGSPHSVSLNGSGTAGPLQAAGSAWLQFAPTAVGATSTPGSFAIQINNPMTIASAEIAAGFTDFSAGALQGGGCTLGVVLSAGTMCTVPVTFQPTAPGVRSNPLVITDSADNKYAFGLSGTGTAPLSVPSLGVIQTVAGNGAAAYSGDGATATAASFNSPRGMAMDAAGNIYVADTQNSVVRRISAGIVTTIAGNGKAGYGGDGGPATAASLNQPIAVAVDAAGDVLIADTGNSRIREVSAASGVIFTVAGTGTSGYSGDGGPALAAELSGPRGVAVDGTGVIYISDSGNFAVRRIDPTTGLIATYAANISVSYEPWGLALDSAGDLYIADQGLVAEVVASTGQKQFVAGNLAGSNPAPGSSPNGDGGPATAARLQEVFSVAVDSAGDLYIADAGGEALRRVNSATGIIGTVAGGNGSGFAGDGGSAGASLLNGPGGIAVDGSGDIYFTDSGNNRAREISAAAAPLAFGTQPTGVATPANIELVNAGNTPLSIGATAAGPTPFQLQSSGGGDCAGTSSLAPGASCLLGVGFAPAATAAYSGTASFTDNSMNATGSLQSVALTGTGVLAPAVSISTSSLSFGNQPATVTSAAQTVAVNNLGSAPLTVSGVKATASDAGNDYAETNTCSFAVAPGQSCSVAVTFTPSTTGTIAGTLTVAYVGSGSPAVVALSGTGMGAKANYSGFSNYEFDPQMVGTASAPLQLSFENDGNIPLTVSGIAATGDFSATSNCGTLAPPTPLSRSSCTLNLIFTPSALGTRTGTLTIASNAFNNPNAQVALSGTGAAQPTATLSANLSLFPVTALLTPSSDSVMVTVQNMGPAPLVVNGITNSSSAFSVSGSNCSAPLRSGILCSFNVNFDPATFGIQSDTVTVTDNAVGGSQTVTVMGSGAHPGWSQTSGSFPTSTVKAGSTASYHLILGPPVSGNVTLSCTGAPAGANCTLSPPSAVIGDSVQNIGVFVTTGAASSAAPVTPSDKPRLWFLLVLSCLSLLILSRRLALRQSRPALSLAWRLAPWILALGLVACGGGGGGGGGSPPTSGGGGNNGGGSGGGAVVTPPTPTPPGTYTLTVTATGSGINNSVQLLLVVQ